MYLDKPSRNQWWKRDEHSSRRRFVVAPPRDLSATERPRAMGISFDGSMKKRSRNRVAHDDRTCELRRVRPLKPTFLIASVVLVSCGASESEKSGSQRDSICIYETAHCLKNLCKGCTAGEYTSCPPPDDRYSEICSEEDEDACRSRARGPELRNKADIYDYTRNLRILRGVTKCSDYRAGETGTKESICSGDCT